MWCWIQAVLVVLGGIALIVFITTAIAFVQVWWENSNIRPPQWVTTAWHCFWTVVAMVGMLVLLVAITVSIHGQLPCAR
jgi:hypothetical protein